MTQSHRIRVIGAAAVCATLVILACGKSGSSSGGGAGTGARDGGGGAVAKSSDGARATGKVTGLTYARGVVALERRDGLAALKGISTNGDLLLFAGGSGAIT